MISCHSWFTFHMIDIELLRHQTDSQLIKHEVYLRRASFMVV